ncbi:hypothetical protein Trydic_g17811 [Trypoxylus dichotomus]
MDLSEKVALVTGGLSGIGASCVEEFLKNGIKGVVIADISEGEEITQDFNTKYGEGRVTFVKTDVSDKESFKNAFEKTVNTYNSIDILINAAGIVDETKWLNIIQVNLVGSALGCHLAINTYFPKYKSGTNTYIINISSIVGLIPHKGAPHYSATKHGLVGLTRSYGTNEVISEQGIFVMALCPGRTDTPLLSRVLQEKISFTALPTLPYQKPEAVSKSVIQILQKPENGSIWLIDYGKLSKVELFTYETLTASVE